MTYPQPLESVTEALRSLGELLASIGEATKVAADLVDRLDEVRETMPLTVDEAATALRVNERTIRRYIADGTLEAFKVRQMWRVPRSAILELIATKGAE